MILKLTLCRLTRQVFSYIFFMKRKRGTKKGSKTIGTNKYHFGKVLALARRKKGITQVELSRLLNTSSRVISYYEREATNPSWDTVCKIATALKMSPESMLEPAAVDTTTVPVIDRGLSKRFEIAQRLPMEARKQLKKFIDTLAKANNMLELQTDGTQ
jgi:transcriptional regulator with XRE-family HTH domain